MTTFVRGGRSRLCLMLMASFLFLCVGLVDPGAPWAQMSSPECPPTRTDIEGPFYEPDAPMRTQTGQGLKVSGRVQSANHCKPLQGARIEWWSANPSGSYTDTHRATIMTDKDGVYGYETVFPSGYSSRPPHLHVKVSASGYRPLTTQIYPQAGQKQIDFDFNLLPE